MKKNLLVIALPLVAALAMILSIWGPEALSGYKDKGILEEIHEEVVETAGSGYRYTLSSNERLYILAECLNSQKQPESDQYALTRKGTADLDYEDLAGTYAFVVNHRGPSGKEITDDEIYETGNKGLKVLKELGIIPESVKKVEPEMYDAVLNSAIDVLEPRNNISVWKLSLKSDQKNVSKENRLIDVYIDADNGKIYEFYVRTKLTWDSINPDEIIEKWGEYMGLSSPLPYESEYPWMELTPYYKKYEFWGMGEEKTIVTLGFYEGINELFLKVSN